MKYPINLLAAAITGGATGERPVRRSRSARASSRGNSSDSPGRVASMLGRLASRMLREREFRRSSAALHALDDAALKDIGIARDEIDRVVRHGRDRR
jgi:uncharacterized protein YjiS (DUF1127 family)